MFTIDCSGLFGNSATSDDGRPAEREERDRDFTELRPRAHHADICGRRFIRQRQARIVGGGVADYGEWPWQVITNNTIRHQIDRCV